jgi:ferric-dicitrate binding protein FerR (iron transport regulator)
MRTTSWITSGAGRRRLMVAVLALGLALAAGIGTTWWDIPGLGPTEAAAAGKPGDGGGSTSGNY